MSPLDPTLLLYPYVVHIHIRGYEHPSPFKPRFSGFICIKMCPHKSPFLRVRKHCTLILHKKDQDTFTLGANMQNIRVGFKSEDVVSVGVQTEETKSLS